jgi:hypothetical protein
MMKRSTIQIGAFLVILLTTLAVGGSAYSSPNDREGRFMAGSSAGFGVVGSEGMFVTDLALDYFIHPNISVGYEMIFGVQDFFVWGNQAVGKHTFDFDRTDWSKDLKPYLEMLLGFVVSANGGTDVGFLGGFGFGADYFVDQHWALGTNMIFDFSNEIAGKNFAWIWKVIEFKYLF